MKRQQTNTYNLTGGVLIKAEKKRWISKRSDSSIKHTPSPVQQQSLPELRLCGAASLADRKTGEDEWKNRAEMGGKKGREKWWLQFHARVWKGVTNIQSCTSSRVPNKMLDRRRKTYDKVGKNRKPDREKDRKRDFEVVSLSIILYGYTEEKHRGGGP